MLGSQRQQSTTPTSLVDVMPDLANHPPIHPFTDYIYGYFFRRNQPLGVVSDLSRLANWRPIDRWMDGWMDRCMDSYVG